MKGKRNGNGRNGEHRGESRLGISGLGRLSGERTGRSPAPKSPPRRDEIRKPIKGMWIYGIHPVMAAVANPERTSFRIVVTPENEATLGARLAVLIQSHPRGGPTIETMPREAIERLLPRGAVHQGIAAQVDKLAELDIDDIVRATEHQHDARVIVLDQLTDPHNVGAIIRSAAAFGVAAIVLQDRNAPGATATMAKAASGALERVPLVQVVNIVRALERLKQAGFWCVGLDGGAAQALHEADLSGKVALVLGAEGEGLRRLTREHCDLMVRIPIGKNVESLNVSNAAAIALYDFARRG